MGLTMGLAVAGCGNPMRDMPRLGDIDVSGGAAQMAQEGEAQLLSEATPGPTEEAAVAEAQRTARPPRGLFALFGLDRPAMGGPARGEDEEDGPPITRVRAPALDSFRGGASGTDVPAGTVMPFGQVGRVCDLPRSQRGTRIERIAGFEVWDTVPGSTEPRSHYITGFSDGCARVVTGALIVPGDLTLYESVRFMTEGMPFQTGQTDQAYDEIKARLCGVRASQPCGPRLSRIERNTGFLSVYDRFRSSGTWLELLLHDGIIAGQAVKG